MTSPGPPVPDGSPVPEGPPVPGAPAGPGPVPSPGPGTSPGQDTSPGPDPSAPGGPRAERVRRPVVWMAAAVVAVPLSFGGFWLARHSGAAQPLCGDRPGTHYPVCQLPPPWGTGAPPTTSAFVP